MLLGPFRINARVWAFAAGCVFVALGFVNPAIGRDDYSLWACLGMLLRDPFVLPPIMLYALILAVPAVILGWVVHAFVLILYSVSRDKLASRAIASDQRKNMPNEPPQQTDTRITALPMMDVTTKNDAKFFTA
jgi:hypothetical protein